MMKGLPTKEYKRSIIKHRGKKIDTLVETGTFTGDTIWELRNDFSNIHSIELSSYYYENAIKRFGDFRHIHLYHGDSAEVLKDIVPGLPRSLFWLDAHFSAGNTAKGDKETPIVEELMVILDSGVPHAILIDDARCFGKSTDFPTLKELRGIIGDYELKNDIIWKDLL